MDNINFKTRSYLLLCGVVSVVASHFIVVHNADESWLELFTKGYYYLSLLYSAVIAFILMLHVYFVARWNGIFGQPYKNRIDLLHRQFVWGFLGGCLVAFFLATVLYALNGQNILKTNYLEKLFLLVVLFIFSLNLLHLLYHFIKYPSARNYRVIRPDQSKAVQLRYEAQLHDMPAFIFFEEKLYFSVDFQGKRISWPYTIEESMTFLPNDIYFRVSRGVIVHRSAIFEVKQHSPRAMQLSLILDNSPILTVSRRKIASFKDWLNEKEKEDYTS